MKKVYIHIGVGKTGTTAIQNTMMLYRKEIADQGILYPATGLNGVAHHNLVTLWQSSFTAEDAALYSELIRECEASEQETILISSEKFCFAQWQFVKAVSEALTQFDVRIIVYVRTQVAQIESTFLLWLRLGYAYGNNFQEFFQKYAFSFDYNQIIKSWVSFFGKDAIIIRVYDHPELRADAFSGIQQILGIKA